MAPIAGGPPDPRRLAMTADAATADESLPGAAARARTGPEGPLAMVVAVTAIAAVAGAAIMLWTGS
ncbi:hypothetical protein [Roseomonas sp. BN140053]|uniref:hypothetical protein n=1 Tax=Roseomonas sp. BN140053 TaxID=3391898 RepID=UPI0039E81B87